MAYAAHRGGGGGGGGGDGRKEGRKKERVVAKGRSARGERDIYPPPHAARLIRPALVAACVRYTCTAAGNLEF